MFERNSAGSAMRRFVARAFRERELLLRSQGRVRFLRLTPRLQIFAACVVASLMIWGAAGTVLSWLEYDRIVATDARLADSRVAYDDLLEEIANYQRKVSDVTGKLRENQAELIGRFARADAMDANFPRGGGNDPATSGRLAAITESRDAMRRHLHQLDVDLQEMTDLDELLAKSLNSIQADLVTAVAERKKVYQARGILKEKVEVLEGKLRISRGAVAQLRTKSETLKMTLAGARGEIERARMTRTGLESRRSELERALANAAVQKAELKQGGDDLRSELAAVRGDYERMSGARAELDVRAAALQGSLRAEEERATGLENDLRRFAVRLGTETGDPSPHNPAKETLSDKVASLLDRLTDLHGARSRVIDTLNTRTAGNIEDAERIIAMTGLDVESLLKRVEAAEQLGKGGPFIALSGATGGLAEAVQGLDSQLNRLGALRMALQAVPLVSPVDTYRLSSGYGKRRDPITKKWAMHSGVDLSSRSKTVIRASAPGTVLKAGWNGRYGRMIEIDHGYGVRTRYGHLRKINVKKGQKVSHREKIGLLGSSGRSTGPHLHYEILYGKVAMDPMRFVRAGKHVFKE